MSAAFPSRCWEVELPFIKSHLFKIADLKPDDMFTAYVLIKSKLEFDQLIIEKNHKIEWIHVSWNGDKNRNQAFAMNLSNKNMPIIQ